MFDNNNFAVSIQKFINFWPAQSMYVVWIGRKYLPGACCACDVLFYCRSIAEAASCELWNGIHSISVQFVFGRDEVRCIKWVRKPVKTFSIFNKIFLLNWMRDAIYFLLLQSQILPFCICTCTNRVRVPTRSAVQIHFEKIYVEHAK